MQNPSDEKQKRASRARAYFICAFALLFVFALFWSVDSALAYILFGIFCFFLALALITWPWQKIQFKGDQAHHQPRAETANPPGQAKSFDDLLDDVLKKAKKEEQKVRSETPPPSSRNYQKIIPIVSVFIFSIFLVIFLSVVIDRMSGNTPSESYTPDYLQQATEFYNNNVFDSAYVNYKWVLRKNPDDTDALFGLANTLSAMDKPDSAIILYDRVVSLNPTLVGATYNKAWVEYHRKNYARATVILKELIEKNPTYLEPVQLLGDVYYDQGQQPEALRWYEMAYDKGLRNNWICYVMGFLYQTNGNTQRAIDLYKESLTYDSTEMDIYKRLGELIPGKEGEYYRSVARGETQW